MTKGNKLQYAWELMDITGVGPRQLLAYTQKQVQNCVEAQICYMANCDQIRSHSEEREVSPRRKTNKGNKIDLRSAPILNSLLLEDGSISTDLVQIHNKLTDAFAEHFVCPQRHMQSPLQTEDGIHMRG